MCVCVCVCVCVSVCVCTKACVNLHKHIHLFVRKVLTKQRQFSKNKHLSEINFITIKKRKLLCHLLHMKCRGFLFCFLFLFNAWELIMLKVLHSFYSHKNCHRLNNYTNDNSKHLFTFSAA